MASILKISDAASLAFHAVVYLAANEDRLISTGEMAETLKVSENHLSKVLQRLTRAGLVRSIRGPKGGYLLKRSAQNITLLEVYEAIEGKLVATDCLLGEPVCDRKHCILGGLLASVDSQARDYLASKKISELTGAFEKKSAKGATE